MTEPERTLFKQRMKEYFQNTPIEQIHKDIEDARPKEVPHQYPQEGFQHTGIYRPPTKNDWYQSWTPKKPKQIMEGQEQSYGPKQCRWILKKTNEA